MIAGAMATAVVVASAFVFQPSHGVGQSAPTRALFGAYAGDGNRDYRALESRLGHKLAIVQKFFGWGDDPFAFVNAVGDRIPLVTIEPTHVSWSSIASGSQDAYLNMLAAKTKAYGKPVYFRIAPEMNGDWTTWKVTPAAVPTFRAAWAHIASILHPAGGRLVWSPNDVTSNRLASPATYYPGSSHVDIIGIDSYTWNDGRTSFDSILAKPYSLYSRLDPTKDIWVSETGCNQGSAQAGWVADMARSTAYPRLKGIVYFDSVGNRDWRLTSPATLAALRAALSNMLATPKPSR
jgi:hypothetical protein